VENPAATAAAPKPTNRRRLMRMAKLYAGASGLGGITHERRGPSIDGIDGIAAKVLSAARSVAG